MMSCYLIVSHTCIAIEVHSVGGKIMNDSDLAKISIDFDLSAID